MTQPDPIRPAPDAPPTDGPAGGDHPKARPARPAGRRRRRIALATLLLAILAALVWYVDDGHELLWPKRWGVVAQGRIYRSGEPTLPATRRVVQRLGIRTIIDLGAHAPGSAEEHAAQDMARRLGVTRYRFGLIGDATGDPNDYVLALRIMNDPAHQPVWVHCAAGSERTGCLVALHRVILDGWDLDRAYAETHRYDHHDNPFLRPMLERWLEPIRQAYLHGGTIPYDPARDALGGAGRGETNGPRLGPFDALTLPPPPQASDAQPAGPVEPGTPDRDPGS
ncbi:MAG: hypothetical protein KatS3mg103_0847 [Phycisphaerales bacterium]|nr:MAG: hypothetical protein KatS3mg103_0847 [Phycisphaerales bacterium]